MELYGGKGIRLREVAISTALIDNAFQNGLLETRPTFTRTCKRYRNVPEICTRNGIPPVTYRA